MQISIIDAQSGNKFILSTGIGTRMVNTNPLAPTQIQGPDKLTVNSTVVIQEDEVIRALSKVYSNRMNTNTRVSFETHITHDTIAHAEQFMLDHRSQVPLFGTLVIVTTQDGGTVTRYINGCGIPSIDMKQQGVGTDQTYAITGGAISTKLLELS